MYSVTGNADDNNAAAASSTHGGSTRLVSSCSASSPVASAAPTVSPSQLEDQVNPSGPDQDNDDNEDNADDQDDGQDAACRDLDGRTGSGQQQEAPPGAEDDGTIDVVITGVEVDPSAGTSVVGAATYLLGALPYLVELVITRARGSYCIRRPVSSFLAALGAAVDDALAPMRPEFPPKHHRNDAALAQWCTEMNQFLTAHGTALTANLAWMDFVADPNVDGDQRNAHMTAIEFILQPFPYEKIYVPRGSRHEVVVPVKRENQFVVWHFEVEDHDIDFTVQYLPLPQDRRIRSPASGNEDVALEVIHPTTRYIARTNPGSRPVEGMYECRGPGSATLVWDNSYSRLRGKNISYQVQVVHSSIMNSANAAADAFDEAIQARVEREKAIRAAKASKSTARVVLSPRKPPPDATQAGAAYLYDTSAHLYRQIFADKLPAQGWLVSAPMNVAGKLVSRLFGSPEHEQIDSTEQAAVSGADDINDDHIPSASEAKSLLEELNGLNMQLLERLEGCEDTIAKLTAERDQERSKVHLRDVEKENLAATIATKDIEVEGLRNELQRIEREREAWRDIQQERDALLEEKHRWAMADDFVAEESHGGSRSDLDSETTNRLEHELGQAEATVLRLRAELGYPLTNHLTGTSTRLEKIAREMARAKKEYEDQIVKVEQEINQLKQQVVKHRSQKRVLVAEIKNMQTQSDGQIAVAMAEANEARMVNKRLKKQNELLLTQIRSLVDDAREQEKKLQDQVEMKILEAQVALQRLNDDKSEDGQSGHADATLQIESPRIAPQRSPDGDESIEDQDDESTVPYTLTAADIALLNGDNVPTTGDARSRALKTFGANPHRDRLIKFFEANDPAQLAEVDNMLDSYAGVEDMLFESLELKYSFLRLSGHESR